MLRETAGDVEVAADDDGGTTWITARPEWAPEFTWLPLPSPAEVDALDPSAFTDGQHYAYAWIDEGAGRPASRMFAPEMGIVEDEATGAAAIALTARLGRDAAHPAGRRVRAGHASRSATGSCRVGGPTVYDRTIEATL